MTELLGTVGTPKWFRLQTGAFGGHWKKNKLDIWLNFRFIINYLCINLPSGGGVAALSSPGGGSGCCGNSEAGIPAPGNTGNTGGRGPGLEPGWAWPSMAERTAGCGGLERSWGPGREMEASLNRCSVNELLW